MDGYQVVRAHTHRHGIGGPPGSSFTGYPGMVNQAWAGYHHRAFCRCPPVPHEAQLGRPGTPRCTLPASWPPALKAQHHPQQLPCPYPQEKGRGGGGVTRTHHEFRASAGRSGGATSHQAPGPREFPSTSTLPPTCEPPPGRNTVTASYWKLRPDPEGILTSRAHLRPSTRAGP